MTDIRLGQPRLYSTTAAPVPEVRFEAPDLDAIAREADERLDALDHGTATPVSDIEWECDRCARGKCGRCADPDCACCHGNPDG